MRDGRYVMRDLVKAWFGDRFYQLHPLLQQLHETGGCLSGDVLVKVPGGIAGLLGRYIAKKFSIPVTNSSQAFTVIISQRGDSLGWDRCFANQVLMQSTFTPTGNIKQGFWRETTGALCLQLGVDIKEGGWYWRCLKATYKGFSLPLWLLPQLNAYKRIEENRYSFYVGFKLPLFGEVLSYSGLLMADCAH